MSSPRPALGSPLSRVALHPRLPCARSNRAALRPSARVRAEPCFPPGSTPRPHPIPACCIATGAQLSPADARSNLICAEIQSVRVWTPDHLEQAVVEASAMLVEEPFRVVVIDSIMNLYRVGAGSHPESASYAALVLHSPPSDWLRRAPTEYVGRGELAERQQRLNHLLFELKKTAEEHQVAVVLTSKPRAKHISGRS